MTRKMIFTVLFVMILFQWGECVQLKTQGSFRAPASYNDMEALEENQKRQRDESVDNYIRLVIENFADAMKTGIPILGIPVLDPFNISVLTLPDIETDTFILHANASNISVNGTSSFTPTFVHVDFEASKMYLDLHFVGMRVDGWYWCDGLLLLIFPIFGDGFFYIDILSITSIGVGGIIVTDDDHLQITELQDTLTFEQLHLYFDNFLGGGSFGDEMNAVLDILADTIVKELLPLINSTVLPALVKYLNSYLMQHTISEIIDGILPGPYSLPLL